MFASRPLLLLASLAPLTGAAEKLDFNRDIRPILAGKCYACHGPDDDKREAGLRLDTREGATADLGGYKAIVPGNPDASETWKRIITEDPHDVMPPPSSPKQLTATERELLRRWIAEGAEYRDHWSFLPLAKVTPPRSPGTRNGIDAFIRDRLAEHQLAPAPEAAAATLIRRVSLDLTGLPPEPAEVAAFTREYATDPGAYDRLVERLLASPHFGERWGRHWLDLAGYADSDGYTDKDLERKWAWKYRDYVINALNKDKPFDVFVREQLAGDEMVPLPHKNLPPEAIEKIAATGFLRMAADGTGAMNDNAARNSTIADTIKIIGSTLYGLTIDCAQCHDHRYDPISQADYYRLRAIFEPGFDTKTWRTPAGRLVSLLTDSQRAEADKIEAEAKKVDEARLAKQEEFISEVLEKELAKTPEEQRETLRSAYRTAVKMRSPEQVALLKKFPRINQLSGGSLYLYDTTYKTKHADTLKKMAAEAAEIRARKPAEEFLQAFTELPKKPEAVPATYIFHRGDIEQPKDKVQPGDLTVLAGQRKIEIPEKDPKLPTTGRRLAFANALTDGKHPLLARVIVNQVWKRHFGRGLVNTPNDFGRLGEAPSHPELLDWLADEFMAQGWSLKRLHHLILTSRTWQQSSLRDATRDRIDPDNRLLSRMNVQRLEAETLRDSFLAVSGKLTPRLGGPPVPVTYSEEGQVIIGIDTRDTAGRQTGKHVSLEGDEYRRSLYVQARRSMPLEMFAAFDAPAMTDANCTSRPVTTVSPQSLLLMNNTSMREHAQDFALRVQSEVGSEPEKQAERAWRLAYGRSPSLSDLQDATAFINTQTEHYRANPSKLERVSGPPEKTDAPAELLGLTALCHALLSSNGFLYVD